MPTLSRTTYARDRHVAMLVAFFGIFALILLTASCGRPANAESAPAAAAAPAVVPELPPVTVTADSAEPGIGVAPAASPSLVISGTLTAEAQAVVRAEIAGAVTATLVDRGARVAAGAAVARLQDRAQRAAHAAAQSDVRTATSAASLARRRAERMTRLLAGGAVSAEEAEDAAQGVVAADAALDAARSRLATAVLELSHAVVRAPIDGYVSERAVAAGDVVQVGTPLFTVLDPATIRLDAAVPSSQLAAVRAGAAVEFTVAGYPGRTFRGRVARVSPAADAATRQIPVTITIDNRDGQLVAGLFAEGHIVGAFPTPVGSR